MRKLIVQATVLVPVVLDFVVDPAQAQHPVDAVSHVRRLLSQRPVSDEVIQAAGAAGEEIRDIGPASFVIEAIDGAEITNVGFVETVSNPD